MPTDTLSLAPRELLKMLADGKIDSLDTHLEQFKLNNQTSQNDLQVSGTTAEVVAGSGMVLTISRTSSRSMANY